MRETIRIFGVKIDKLTLNEVVKKVKELLDGDKTRTIYTPNTEIIMEARKDSKLKEILNDGDLVIPDGIGLIHASRIKKKPLPERVTGFDLSLRLIELSNKYGYSIYFLGGKEGVALEAKKKVEEKYPNINIVGIQSGYFKGTHTGNANHPQEQQIIENINNSKADILFVGFGAPKQENWIYENKDKLNCKIIIGNGGTIDVLAEKVKRAPEIYQKLGIEWLYRLMKDPKRLKRQMSLPIFVLIVLFSREKVVE